LSRPSAAYQAGRKNAPDAPVNPGLEALAPDAKGTRTVVIQANRKQEILEALKRADDLKVKMVLSGGIDAWKLADEPKKRKVPVICGPVLTPRRMVCRRRKR
jgi:hypothetical protein